MDENNKEDKGFTVTDRRISSKSEEEKKQADIDKEQSKIKEAENIEKTASMPEIDFASFILSLSTSALIQLGEIADPITNKPAKNIEAAKQTINILGILHEKTKGNLTPQEQSVMDKSLYDLRMIYIKHTTK